MRFGHTFICREDAVSDFDLYESEIEELYQKPEEPKVELTIDEAKGIYQAIIDGYSRNYDFDITALKSAKMLLKRIDQAEGK